MYDDEELDEVDINPEEDLIIIIHKGGDYSVIPPESEDVSYIQIELLEQILVSIRPSFFLLAFIKLEILLIKVWEYISRKDES